MNALRSKGKACSLGERGSTRKQETPIKGSYVSKKTDKAFKKDGMTRKWDRKSARRWNQRRSGGGK